MDTVTKNRALSSDANAPARECEDLATVVIRAAVPRVPALLAEMVANQ